MSLDWSIDKIKDYKTVCWRGEDADGLHLRHKTDILIWATMRVDLSEISAKNIDEWLRRIAVCKLFDAPFGREYYEEDGKRLHRGYYPDRAILEEHIGLGTNASTIHFTRWYKKMCDQALSNIDWKLQQEDKNDSNIGGDSE